MDQSHRFVVPDVDVPVVGVVLADDVGPSVPGQIDGFRLVGRRPLVNEMGLELSAAEVLEHEVTGISVASIVGFRDVDIGTAVAIEVGDL